MPSARPAARGAPPPSGRSPDRSSAASGPGPGPPSHRPPGAPTTFDPQSPWSPIHPSVGRSILTGRYNIETAQPAERAADDTVTHAVRGSMTTSPDPAPDDGPRRPPTETDVLVVG